MEIKQKLQIPGLIHGKKDKAHDKLNEEEVKYIREEFSKYINDQEEVNNLANLLGQNTSIDKYYGNNHLVDPNLLNGSLGTITTNGTGDYYVGYDPYKTIPMVPDTQKFTRIPQRDVYGPPIQQDPNGFLDLLKQYSKPGKSAFEEIIDALFSISEKEQFLIDAGYMIENNLSSIKITRKLADGTIKTIATPLDELFLKEITVKFKNLLLAKSVLKLKL